MTSWSQKLIQVSVQLAQKSGAPQPNQIAGPIPAGGGTTLSGARTSVRIRNAGAMVGCEADVRVYGVQQSMMNQLTTLGLTFNLVTLNQLTVKAGDASGLSTVFQGTIYHAYGDYEHQPDVSLMFGCVSGTGASVSPVPPSSFRGSQSVVQILQTLAKQMNLNFENNGVSGSLSNQYVEGSLIEQAWQIARHAGIAIAVINGTTLAICPRGGQLSAIGAPPVITAGQNMQGYPAFTQQGIIVKHLFNPSIQFMRPVQLQGSSITQANGTWVVYKLDLDLDSLVPHGQWMGTAYCYRPGTKVIV